MMICGTGAIMRISVDPLAAPPSISPNVSIASFNSCLSGLSFVTFGVSLGAPRSGGSGLADFMKFLAASFAALAAPLAWGARPAPAATTVTVEGSDFLEESLFELGAVPFDQTDLLYQVEC
jgi:hypothetical protein